VMRCLWSASATTVRTGRSRHCHGSESHWSYWA